MQQTTVVTFLLIVNQIILDHYFSFFFVYCGKCMWLGLSTSQSTRNRKPTINEGGHSIQDLDLMTDFCQESLKDQKYHNYENSTTS